MGFDELAAAGRAAVLGGAHETEAPPDSDAPRWGPSVIIRPDENALSRLQKWTEHVVELAGPAHWSTGSTTAAHITVRTLGQRQSAALDAALVDRYAAALTRAASDDGLSFAATLMLVTPISVMLGLEPTDDEPDRLARSLGAALGADGWFEQDRVRDIWYVNLVHFAGPVADPVGLVRWVERCPVGASFTVHGRSLDVVRWEFDGSQMVPATLACVPLH